MKFWYIICFLWGTLLPSRQTLLIFQGLSGQPISDAAGMNVGHQVLTGLIQKAAPMLVASDVLHHILLRGSRCSDQKNKADSAYRSILDLIATINQKIVAGISLSEINQTCNFSWYQKHYPYLAGLNSDQNKSIMFDYFCSNVDQLMSGWTIYKVDAQYFLFLPTVDHANFMLKKSQLFLQGKFGPEHALPETKRSLAQVLKSLLQQKNVAWSFYLTGHGYHADQQQPESMIAGMNVEQFKDFLMILNDYFTTEILVYSSCYSSGSHLLAPYQRNKKDLLLRFPVITTCLTDAPVYVFGTPSGLKLPPYGAEIFLEEEDVAQHHLSWYCMQNFKLFVELAKTKKYKEIAQSLMVYQECEAMSCDLLKLENLPLIRMPNTIFFVPIDSKYVAAVVHSSTKKRTITNKYGLLWYVKQYQGAIKLDGIIPQFISMVPGRGAVWALLLDGSKTILSNLVRKAFFSVEDMHGAQIFLFDKVLVMDQLSQKRTLHQLMVLPNCAWLPGHIPHGEFGLCCYRQAVNWYGLPVGKDGQTAEPYAFTPSQKKIAEKLWLFLRKESKQQQDLAADKLWSADMAQQRFEEYEKILKQCQHELVCQS